MNKPCIFNKLIQLSVWLYFISTLSISDISKASQAREPLSRGPAVLTFKLWKQDKAQFWARKLTATRMSIADLEKGKVTSVAIEKIRSLRLSEKHELLNLSVANQLGIKDYIALYLNRQTDPNKFWFAAHGLDQQQVAELIQAYGESLSSDLGRPASDMLLPTGGHPLALPQAVLQGK